MQIVIIADKGTLNTSTRNYNSVITILFLARLIEAHHKLFPGGHCTLIGSTLSNRQPTRQTHQNVYHEEMPFFLLALALHSDWFNKSWSVPDS